MGKIKPFDYYWQLVVKEAPWTLPAVMTTLGHGCFTSHDYYWDDSRRDYETPWIALQYTLNGEGMLIRDGREMPIRPGQLMIATIPDNHIYCLPRHSPYWEVYSLAMHGDEALRMAKEIINHYGNVLTPAGNGPFIQVMNEIRGRFMHGFHSAFENSDYAMRLLFALANEMEHSDNEGQRPVFVDKIYTMAAANPLLTYKQLLNCTPYSEEYFNRIFKKHTGQTPHQFIKQMQLKHVVHLLRFSMLSIKEIAIQCGFHDSPHLFRDLKSHLHISPSEIRKSGLWPRD